MVKDAGVSTSEAPSPKMALKLKNTYIDSTSFSFADEFNDLTFDGPRTVKTIKRQISPYSAFSEHEEPDLEKEPQMQEHKEPGECWETWRLADSIPNDDLDTEGLLAHPGMAPLFPFGHMPNMPMVSPGWMPMLMPMLPPMAGGSHMGMPGFPNLAAPIPSVGFEDSAIVHTVMMRNLPNKYTQQMLLEEINLAGFAGTFDFFYLPIDPETHANRGYAFINFDNPSNAHKFMATFEGRQMYHFDSKKFVSCMPATLQGFEANYSHYASARVSRGDPSSRPLFLREPNPHMVMPASTIRTSRRRGRRQGTNSTDEVAAPAAKFQPQAPCIETPATVEPMRVGAAVQSGKKFCGACGGKRKPEYKFCQFCGTSLP
eukprot:gnl/TRDRNA2_/TRDRNA2_142384_c1_seq2.p1 gnl/TRDRNA2_/TRDRNA2_142384_c1~~gnl/TRDRNA2_/TRDRNA2_142384_c1_seq2.p1  ORF type:complete len:394 (+),score=77.11 gnl/TRDRNA2_/TRDRNA2_142384_c1_seq2:66-1184(+)